MLDAHERNQAALAGAVLPTLHCEAMGCENETSTFGAVKLLVGNEAVYRYLCPIHWRAWVRPHGRDKPAVEQQDDLMRLWGWPGESWWRD